MDRNNGYTDVKRHGHNSSSSQNYSSNMGARTAGSAREPLTQHDELIRYIKEDWHKVNEQGPHGATVICRNDSDTLKNFKPFDLEGYFILRLLKKLHMPDGHQ